MADKSITTKVSVFYSKMDKIPALMKKQDSMKFKRFKQGMPCVRKHGIGANGQTVDQFMTELENLINMAVEKRDNQDFIRDPQLFNDIKTFFEYV